MLFTGDWDVLDGHRIRRWRPRGDSRCDVHEAGGKRPIKATITSWVGTSACEATHFHVRVEEQENCFWGPEQNDWVSIYGDNAKDGFRLEATVYSQDVAEAWADKFVAWIQAQPADYETYVVRDWFEDEDENEDEDE